MHGWTHSFVDRAHPFSRRRTLAHHGQAAQGRGRSYRPTTDPHSACILLSSPARRATPAQGPAWTGAPERTTESKQSADRWWADTISHALAPLARGAPGICVGKRGELLGRQKNASMHGRLTLFNLTQTTCQADSFHTVRCHRWVGCLQL